MPGLTLAYVSERFGGTSGANQSAFDILIALLANYNNVAVYSNQKLTSYYFTDNYSLSKPRWCLPITKCFDSFHDFDSNHLHLCLKNIKEYFCQGLIKLRTHVALINSLENHDFFVSKKRKIGGKPIIIVRESPNHFGHRFSLRSLDWAFKAMKLYENYIFVSDKCRIAWQNTGVLDNKKTFYLPNCCREDIVQTLVSTPKKFLRERLELPADRFTVVCVGSIQYRKGQDIFIESLESVFKLFPSVYVCFLGSPIGQWGATTCSRILDQFSEKQIKLVGRTPKSLEYIRAADLLVLPSRAEAMPRVILEAMALKTSVIASDTDGIPELIEDQVTGLLFPSENSQLLAEQIVHLMDNPLMRKHLERNAQQRYWGFFSRHHQITRIRQILNSILFQFSCD